MDYSKKSVTSVDVKGKKVLLRCDFNIPLDKETGEITDEGRITASMKTIEYLLDHGAAVIACSHLGRPKGQWNEKLSLKVVAKRLSELLGRPVKMAKDVIGEDARRLAAELQPGEIMLLENLRFHPEEEKNDPAFARQLASMADIYVSDSFGTAHRAHASTAGVAAYLPAYSGFLLAKELRLLGGALNRPLRPFVAILGGAKVSDKLGVIRSLLDKADTLILGGAMVYTFIKAQGGEIGDSLCEDDALDYALEMLDKAKKNGVKFLLPPDTVCAAEFKSTPEHITVDTYHIPKGMIGLDIGPKAIAMYQEEIMKAATVIWNGPMGVFEFPEYEKGTRDIAEAMAKTEALTIIGGGDSAAAARQFGYADKITLISTGGGASLEFLEGKALPGVACLLDRE